MAIGETGKQIIVGGLDGGLKIFSLESVDGLDKFQQNRLLRLDAAAPRKAHDNPITAVAISAQAGIAATGDSSGEIKLWSTETEPPLELTGEPGGYAHLLSYQDDQILFAAAENKIVYWQIGNQRTASRDFAEAVFDQPLTSMVVGPEAKGLAAGDASGRVTLWTPEGDELKKVSFAAHSAPVDGIGFVDNGDTLITVARTGEVARWKLPIEPQRSFDVVDAPDFVVSSPDGRIVGLPSRDKNLDVYSLENGSAVRRHSLSTGQLTAAEFSADNDLVALASNKGRVVFQDSNRRTIAYTQLSDAGITQLVRSPHHQEQFAFATAHGEVGVATFPLKSSGPLATTGEVAAMNQTGTEIVVARGTDLRAVRTHDGQLTNSARIEDERVTSLAIDESLALIGTASGSIWSWAYALPNSNPELIRKGLHESEILAIGTTGSGRVWSCDAKGSTKTTQFVKQQRFDRGSIDVAITAATALREGGVFVLDEQQRLRFASSIDGPFKAGTEQTWSRMIGRTDRIGTIDQAARLMEVRSGSGNLEATIRVAADATIADADIARQTLGIVLNDESVIGVSLPDGSPAERNIAEGTVTQSLISRNGQTVVSVDDQGHLLASSGSGGVRTLDNLGQSVPLALSSDGSLLACLQDGRASCYQISRGEPQFVTKFTDQVSEPVAAQFSADAKGIVFALQSGQIVSVPIAETENVRSIAQLKQPTRSIALDEAHSRIACHHADGSLTVIASDNGDVQYDSAAKEFIAVALDGGRTFAATAEGQLYKLEADGSEMSLVTENLSGDIEVLSVAGDGRYATAITSGGLLVSIDTSTGVTVTRPAYQASTSLLAMTVVGDHAIAIDAGGSWRSHPIPAIATIAPKSSGIRAISVGGDGNWLLGLRSNGALIRWNSPSGKFSAAMRAEFPATVSEMISLGSTSRFAVLTSAQSVATYDAANDSSKAPLPIGTKTSKIRTANSGEIVVLATDEGLRSANLRGGSVDRLQEEWGSLDKNAYLIATEENGQSDWVAVKSDGTFIKSARLASSENSNDFSLGSPPIDVVIRAGLLVSGNASKVNIQREDGSSIGSLDLSDEPVVCLSVHDATANVAACDRKGRLAILRTATNESKRSALPITKVISLIWSDDGDHLAVTDGQRVVTVNSKTGSIESQLMVGVKITKLVSLNEDRLWFFDGSSRLQRLNLPTVRWRRNLGAQATSMAWSETGNNLLALSGSGEILNFDATGNEPARVVVGKANLRSLQAIPNSGGFAFLAENDIHLLDAQGQVAQLPITSAIGLRTLCCSSNGKLLFASNDVGQILSLDLGSPESAAGIVPCDVHCDALATAESGRLLAISKKETKLAVVSDSLRAEIVGRFPSAGDKR